MNQPEYQPRARDRRAGLWGPKPHFRETRTYRLLRQVYDAKFRLGAHPAGTRYSMRLESGQQWLEDKLIWLAVNRVSGRDGDLRKALVTLYRRARG